MKWEKVTLHKDEMPITVYVSKDRKQAVVFPLFGRYHSVHSDKSALDLTIEIMFHVCRDFPVSGIETYDQYVSSKEDTAIIYPKVA